MLAFPAMRHFLLVLVLLGISGIAAAQEPPLQEPPPPAPPPGPPTYRIEELPRGGDKKLRERFTPEQLALLEKLNRRDLEHLVRAERIVVPEDFSLDELQYSPLPQTYPLAEPHPKFLVVDQPSQVFGVYENGRLVRWGPVSSGRKDKPTPSGLFHLNWRSPGRHSTDDEDWYMRWYYNFHNGRGLAFHQLELPGRPASHACVRLLERDARWIYDWGEGWVLDERRWNVVTPGTPVLILGEYDFASPPPWLSLDGLAGGIELPQSVPD